MKYGAPEGRAIAELPAGNAQAIPINPIDVRPLEGDDRFQISYSGYYANDFWRMSIYWDYRRFIR